MRSEETSLYRENDTEDKGTFHSKRLTTEKTICAPTTLMIIG